MLVTWFQRRFQHVWPDRLAAFFRNFRHYEGERRRGRPGKVDIQAGIAEGTIHPGKTVFVGELSDGEEFSAGKPINGRKNLRQTRLEFAVAFLSKQLGIRWRRSPGRSRR